MLKLHEYSLRALLWIFCKIESIFALYYQSKNKFEENESFNKWKREYDVILKLLDKLSSPEAI